MYPDNEPRRGGFGEMVFAGVAIALVCYLSFAALQGEHGLFSLLEVEAEEARLQERLSGLRAERAVIENKTNRLSVDSLDPDLLDEQARKVLTENMRGEFDKTIDPTVAAVKQGGTATTVQVTDVGVKVLDGDRAELITNVTVSAESNGVAQDSASGPLIVRMEKVGGVWLLSDIADQ